MKHLGQTRSVFKHDHLLQTPDTFVRTVLPGMQRAAAIVHCGPALGARFTQYTAELERGGMLGPSRGQRFLYLVEGEAAVEISGLHHYITPGAYAYLPEGCRHSVIARAEARMAVIEKEYESLTDYERPVPLVSYESSIPATPLMDDEALQVRRLLSDDPCFDFAVNTMTYQPGASLSMVEIHVMEHGLLMLEGEGIYRLGDSWYAVQAGDFIWMRSFCPQWFGALGKSPAKYLIYKDANRG